MRGFQMSARPDQPADLDVRAARVKKRSKVPARLRALILAGFAALALAMPTPPAHAESYSWYYGALYCNHIQLDLSGTAVTPSAVRGPDSSASASASGAAHCIERFTLGIPEEDDATLTFTGQLTSHACNSVPLAVWSGTLDVKRADGTDMGPEAATIELTAVTSPTSGVGKIKLNSGEQGDVSFALDTSTSCSLAQAGSLTATINDGSFKGSSIFDAQSQTNDNKDFATGAATSAGE